MVPTLSRMTGLLLAAAYNGHFDVCQLLLDRGADLNKSTKYGWSPLGAAAYNGHLVCVSCC